jgi:hypothetical protein
MHQLVPPYFKTVLTALVRLIFVFFLLASKLFAQQYPVECRILLAPPYTGNLNDYASSPTKLRVMLLLQDFTKPSLEVSVRLRLMGQGVLVENPDDYIATQPITLRPGVPVYVSGLALSENFMPANLQAQGIDVDELFNGLLLPAGSYEWQATAIELYRNRQVSNIGTARMTFLQNLPPLLNAPVGNTELTNVVPQGVLFSWNPRHSANPTLVGGVVYTLYLYELDDDDDPNAIAASGVAPYRVIETSQPNYYYGPSEVPLQPGKRYAWQVQVSDLLGKAAFENNGFSPAESFRVGGKPCPMPTDLSHSLDDQAVSLSWTAVETAQRYELQVRPVGGQAQTFSTEAASYLLLQQATGQRYEYRVATVCGVGQQSPYTAWASYELPEEESWESDPELTYTPDDSYPLGEEEESPEEVGEATDPIEELTEMLNTPISFVILPEEDGEESKILPVLPANPSLEQLEDIVKPLKPTCAGVVATYSCGVHDAVPQYTGERISVNTGDELAMNSLVLKVIEIDGSGNGIGTIKLPMLNGARLALKLSGIKVAKGGCIVAGRAEIADDVPLLQLDAKLKENLQSISMANQLIANAGQEYAGAIAETYNNFAERLAGIQSKAQALAAKLSGGGTPSQTEVNALRKLTETANAEMEQTLTKMKAAFKDQVNAQAEAELTALITANKTQVAALTNFKVGRDAPAALAPVATALSATNPTETIKTQKKLGPLQVEYNGRKYANGAEIILDYKDLFSSNFWLVNGIENEETTWVLEAKNGEVLKSFGGNLSNSLIAIDFQEKDPETLQTYYKEGMAFKITQGSRKIKVKLRAIKLELTKLAVVDAKHTGRFATTGQTLYLVGEGKISAAVSATDYGKNFSNPNLSWIFVKEGQSSGPIEQLGSKNTFTWDFGKNTVGVDKRTISINAYNAIGDGKEVDVVIIDPDKSTHTYTPTELKYIREITKDATGFISLLSGCDPEINITGNVSIASYNEEDEEYGIYYNKVTENGMSMGMTGLMECTFSLPAIPAPIQKWLPKEFKPFFLELSAAGSVSKTNFNYFRNDGFKKIKSKSKGNVGLKLMGGVKLGLEVENETLHSKAALEGKGGISGGFEVDIEPGGCPNDGVKFTFQRSPVVFKASLELAVQVGVLGFGVGPYEFEKQMIGSKEYEPKCINVNK